MYEYCNADATLFIMKIKSRNVAIGLQSDDEFTIYASCLKSLWKSRDSVVGWMVKFFYSILLMIRENKIC